MPDAVLIDGKKIAEQVLEECQHTAQALIERGVTPGLAVVLVGDNPASKVYVRSKRQTCEKLGIRSFAYDLPADISERKLLDLIDELNNHSEVHGILVQMPLPPHIREQRVLNTLDPAKDVDGFHPVNTGKLLNGEECFVPCTPAGCQELLVRYGFSPRGKHVVIIGRSNIVGKPLAALLVQKSPDADATVTICHSRTTNLPDITRQADILVAAIGVPEFVKPDMVREGVVVIDVGINRVVDPTSPKGYRLVGDVDFEGVRPRVAAITPVPGGVGPMTIAMLMRNTLRAAESLTRITVT
ncbi:MAG TPA: bifunctional methylenetetrahydrofolate dehydrogenase/methenyltetrahydrofolate cyclohydrolase FolD [Candidatus Hydrogenedentes bacterium]|nr:bifunctional methylenetetrahydrofolate dehydrogenase/methenyltetrahydrofolate cyclohydrolase FolD [Candidatus Hydrogenedentota bacterium]HOJ67167.1 bifunctional methylenetetrahydrofolate dehydrogenase/methenyltetrahydrofolate cyclohydrolase FolD [Candidatus Hydrogenedentota bacterium]HOK89228.1 bifunctional methylenetetrahydrofolate dehydrogenase/methenyltetrahydrofolate cyclohydrolase FolD [Candidatus Hydrogenedentota bacterium]HPO30352.1 bifunctional methylenetetrahydrofolate dehydrogenase/